jgi:hypothetical protein
VTAITDAKTHENNQLQQQLKSIFKTEYSSKNIFLTEYTAVQILQTWRHFIQVSAG